MLALLNTTVFMHCIGGCQETSALYQRFLKSVGIANLPCCLQKLASHMPSHFPKVVVNNKLIGSNLTRKKSHSMSLLAPLPPAHPQQATSAFKIS